MPRVDVKCLPTMFPGEVMDRRRQVNGKHPKDRDDDHWSTLARPDNVVSTAVIAYKPVLYHLSCLLFLTILSQGLKQDPVRLFWKDGYEDAKWKDGLTCTPWTIEPLAPESFDNLAKDWNFKIDTDLVQSMVSLQ